MSTPKDLPFPLSKIMDPLDRAHLVEARRRLVPYDVLAGQHEARWWEYAMAHRAIDDWCHWYWAEHPTATDRDAPRVFCDVGGAGSKFWASLTALTQEPIVVIDPDVQIPPSPNGDHGFFPCTVEAYAAANTHHQFDCITAISVIEHLDQLRPFIRACRMLLKDGGLLFLTTDCWNLDGDDVAHFHWMRKRIYNPETLRRLTNQIREVGFASFGRTDWTYHGNTVFDYSFASLAMIKK